MLRKNINDMISYIRDHVSLSKSITIFLAAGLLAFGLYNVHSISGVTEGGILGLTLLLEYWFHISPSVSGFIINALSYIFAWRLLGKTFMMYSIVASSGFSFFYAIFERFDPLFPSIANMPLVAAIVGGLFVGISCGICVKCGAATGGDDALAMAISKQTGFKIDHIYLLSDLSILFFSLSYIPLHRIIYSLITVVISGKLIGIIVNVNLNVKEVFMKARLIFSSLSMKRL